MGFCRRKRCWHFWTAVRESGSRHDGRNPSPALAERADYLTEMCLRKHPYEEGISARKGIEY
ncbi:MAG: cob(I)yrinic acid a,c-diamide adenosyltransferase [Ruminococcus callidus]